MQSLIMAFSMYSRIPMPRVEWNEKNEMPVILFLPAVGAVLGILTVGFLLLCGRFEIGPLPAALFVIALHVLYTGGIHLDGLVDTADARHSYLEKEERQRILADPHVGAFGVIRLVLYLGLLVAFLTLAFERVPDTRVLRFALSIPVTGRMLATLAVAWMKPARSEGLFYTFSGQRHGWPLKVAAAVEAAILGAWMVYDLGIAGVAMAVFYAMAFVFVKKMAQRDFGGMSGDLTGWLLCVAELGAVAVGVVTEIATVTFGRV